MCICANDIITAIELCLFRQHFTWEGRVTCDVVRELLGNQGAGLSGSFTV